MLQPHTAPEWLTNASDMDLRAAHKTFWVGCASQFVRSTSHTHTRVDQPRIHQHYNPPIAYSALNQFEGGHNALMDVAVSHEPFTRAHHVQPLETVKSFSTQSYYYYYLRRFYSNYSLPWAHALRDRLID